MKASVDTVAAKADEITQLREHNEILKKELMTAKARKECLNWHFDKAIISRTISSTEQKDQLERASSEKKKMFDLLYEAQQREAAALKEIDLYKRRMRETLDEA